MTLFMLAFKKQASMHTIMCAHKFSVFQNLNLFQLFTFNISLCRHDYTIPRRAKDSVAQKFMSFGVCKLKESLVDVHREEKLTAPTMHCNSYI